MSTITSIPDHKSTRGLTSIELMIALTITALIAAAIAGMLTAVSDGVYTRGDARSVMVRANAAQTRLSAYIAKTFIPIGAELV